MKIQKLICLLLSLTLLLSFTGCKTDNKDNDKEQIGKGVTASLLYCKSDSFNPYTAKTEITRQLVGLVFESLIKLDNEFNVVNRLAKEIENEENVWKVKLIDTKFSDGTPLTAEDVIYSYNLAIKSGKQSVIIVNSYEDYFRLVGKGITNVVSTYLPKITVRTKESTVETMSRRQCSAL